VCGRYASTRSAEDLVAEFDAVDASDGEELRPSYNVAPTDRVRVVRRSRRAHEFSAEAQADVEVQAESEAGRVVSVVRWGLVPSWAKDPGIGSRMLNARAESLAEKPAFRAAFARRRCLVPADGWFEWTPKAHEKGKQAYFMTPAGGGGLVFAGLWEVWGSGEDRLYTCTVVTTASFGPLAAVHDRMPLVLPPERWAAWLGEEDAEPAALLAPSPLRLVDEVEIRPVGAAVGNVRNNGPELLARVDESASKPERIDLNQTLF
jgi:putative SOS response-associated peptidase YedK